MPPMNVMPMKTTALVSMPLVTLKISGNRACRMVPPAMYCSEVMTNWMMI